MRKWIGKEVFFVLAALSLTVSAWAATYEIDPAHSSVGFKIGHLVSKVRGEFNRFQGTIEFDPEKVENSSVTAVIDPSSIDTHIEDRDNHLRGADFFDVQKFPEITFVSKRIEGDKVIGDLTLHSITKEVALTYSFHGVAKDPWGKERAGFSGETVLERKDFGITYNKVLDQGGLLIGNEVKVEIEIEAILKE